MMGENTVHSSEKDVALQSQLRDMLRRPTEQVSGGADLSRFQVLRKEFSSHKYDAAVSFTYDTITFNTACIRFYEEENYVQILVDEEGRRMAIRRCAQYDRNAMQWARNQKKDDKRVTRPIKAAVACARLFEMMGWKQENRYKILGTRKIYENADIVLFLLEEAEEFAIEQEKRADGTVVTKRKGYLPYQWRDSFGDYVEEHDRKQALDYGTTLKLFSTPDGQSYFVQPKTGREKKQA